METYTRTNEQRAEAARAALSHYAQTGQPTYETLTDLLTDLRHWAGAEDVDWFQSALEESADHYEKELHDASHIL